MTSKLSAVAAACVALAVSAGPAWGQSEVLVGHSGWKWGNPQPQGNTLRAVEFAGGVGYAAGDHGTLLRTTDGIGWEGLATGITADLSRIRTIDADSVVVGAGCLLRRSDDGGQTFRRVPFVSNEASCPAGVASFHFPSELVGYIVQTDGTVQATTDGGSSFSGRTAVPGTPATGGQAAPTDVFFVNEALGFVTVGERIFRTTDGGNSWVPRAAAGATLAGLLFVDATTGYAVGAANTLLRTTDGGDTWTQRPVPGDIPQSTLTQIRCAGPGTCLISTDSGERVLRTQDGGTTITAVSPSTQKIFAVAFASGTSAVGVGEHGATVFSADAGAATPSPSFANVGARLQGGQVLLNRVRATNAQLVHATGDNGKLARSVDGGKTWSTVLVPTSEDLSDAWFVDSNTGFALDTADTLRVTGDGGANWTPTDVGTVPPVNAVYAVDRNIAVLFTQRGIFRSTAASDTTAPGTTYETVGSSRVERSAFTDYDRTAGPALYAYGPTSLWVSFNRGQTWRAVRGPMRKPRYRRVDFVSSRIGYALTTDGRVWATRNGGRTWKQLLGVGTTAAYDMAFGDARNGYLAIPSFGGERGGWVLRTSDAGATWRPQLLSRSALAAGGLEAPAGTAAFALGLDAGRGADLLYTGAGGDQGRASVVTVKASTRRLRRAGRVRLTVRVAPAIVGARVLLLAREDRSNRWTEVRVPGGPTTKGGGTYTVTVRVRRTTRFAAQWRGDADHNGDGSGAATVTVRR